MPGYLNYPKTTFQSVKQAPGDGSEVSIFLNLPGGPPPPLDQNPAWQAWNRALNAKLTFQFYAFADLAPKFGTLIAGNDLPDIIKTLVRQDIPLTPELFAAKAADLTPVRQRRRDQGVSESGRAADRAPGRAWSSTTRSTASRCPPPYGQFFWWPLIHQELLDAAGHDASPRRPTTTSSSWSS